MPDDTTARRRAGTGLGLVLALVCAAVLLTALPDHDREGGGCAPRTPAAWTADTALDAEFTRYGDDSARTDDWTGGDGTHSVRLPDGRVLWLFSDTYLGPVHGPPNPVGESYVWREVSTPLVRNSAVVMSRAGRLERTLPAPLFPDPAPGEWRWPVAAQVEPRSPGSAEQVVRVLLWTRTTGTYPWIYGVPAATEVATLSLPDLRVESAVRILDQRGIPDPSRRVLFGTTTTADGTWTYVFGGDDARAAGRPASRAYLARVARGRLADPTAWQYWNGLAWTSRPRLGAVLGDGRGTGVASAFTVVRDQGTYVLFTMAAGTPGLTTVTSYWACAPTGPWHGPGRRLRAPLPQGEVAAYNPQAHPELSGGDGRLVLSYDVNWLDATGGAAQTNLSRNVSLYRPRFVALRLSRG
ncbi:hypothetical protein [Streptomyces sp. NPDC001222]|uniref:hypothetical protein n=1 Tax=Streptomyces sp. NPDC001222 TaxID=3364548 RepID=UPI0036C60774